MWARPLSVHPSAFNQVMHHQEWSKCLNALRFCARLVLTSDLKCAFRKFNATAHILDDLVGWRSHTVSVL